PSLEALARSSQAQLASGLGEERARATLAYLRAEPQVVSALTRDAGSLEIARRNLRDGLEAYRAGDAARAQSLVLAAYLDGVEPVEPMLAVRDRVLLRQVEEAMARLRSGMR